MRIRTTLAVVTLSSLLSAGAFAASDGTSTHGGAPVVPGSGHTTHGTDPSTTQGGNGHDASGASTDGAATTSPEQSTQLGPKDNAADMRGGTKDGGGGGAGSGSGGSQ